MLPAQVDLSPTVIDPDWNHPPRVFRREFESSAWLLAGIESATLKRGQETDSGSTEMSVLKFLGSAVGIIFIIGLLVVIGLLVLIF